MNETKLEKNVQEFVDKCSKEVGKWKAEDFNQDMWSECIEAENGIESPIEQILYCALRTVQTLNRINEYDYRYNFVMKKPYSIGLLITPQQVIGKYRCDFLIIYDNFNKGLREIIVECDSQQFHERTEKERRYEKARDRYFTMQGYKIFHYTGSEIVKRPLEIAVEILAYVMDSVGSEDDFLKDSNCE